MCRFFEDFRPGVFPMLMALHQAALIRRKTHPRHLVEPCLVLCTDLRAICVQQAWLSMTVVFVTFLDQL